MRTPLNLYRVHWFNDLARTAQVATPVHIELPEALTGVKARIVVALGALFPMIRAHKVLAAYAVWRRGWCRGGSIPCASARCGRPRATIAAVAWQSPRFWAAGVSPCCPRA